MKTKAILIMSLSLLPFLTLSLSGNEVAKCQVKITSPQQNSIVSDNNGLSHINLFSFSVSGTVSNLGKNYICIYQKIPGGHEWWRSGEPIKSDELNLNGSWSFMYASCGKKDTPNFACQVKAVVKPKCEKSGSTTKDIGKNLCSTANYTYKTK